MFVNLYFLCLFNTIVAEKCPKFVIEFSINIRNEFEIQLKCQKTEAILFILQSRALISRKVSSNALVNAF